MAKLLSARTAVALLSLAAAACGGGGGGGFGIDPGTVRFTADRDGPLPAPQHLRITVTDENAAYFAGGWMTEEPAWLDVGDLMGETNPYDLALSVNTTSLTAGTYTATLRLGILDVNENVLGYDDVTITYTVRESLSASPSMLAFRQVVDGPAAEAQQVAIDGRGIHWTSAPDASWLHAAPASGDGPAVLSISVDAAALAPGTYDGTVTIAGTGAAADRSAAVAVQLTVDAPALAVDTAALTFSGVNGRTIPGQAVSMSMNNGREVTWSATPGADWIVVDESSGTTPGTVTVGVDPSRGPLSSGHHASTLTLTASYGGATLTQVIAVDLTLTRPTLTVTPSSLTAGGDLGRFVTPPPATLQIALDTGARAYPWTATQDAWVGLDALSGTASGTPTSVHAAWNRTGLTGGTYTGAVHVTAVVNGDTLTADVPVTLNLDAHRILADDDGVAFASMPGTSALSRTLRLRDNMGAATAWTASSDEEWLTVTAGGTTPGDLVLTADPTGLAAGQLYTATVEVGSSDPTVEGSERIRVGLWVGAAAPNANATIAASYQSLAVDPIRPYAYVHAGGPGVTVYNVYTGAVVTTISTGTSPLGPMAIASDGSRLYVSDGTHRAIVPVELSDFSVGTAFALGTTTQVRLAYVRTNGERLLATGHGHLLDAVTGTDLGGLFGGGYYGNAILATSRGGGRLAAGDAGISPSSFTVYSLDFTAVGGGRAVVASVTSGSQGSNAQDLALDASGSLLYTASGAPYQFGVFDVTVRPATELDPLPGHPYPRNVEVAADGRVFGGADAVYEAEDTWIYGPTGALLGTLDVAGYARAVYPGQLKVSGDGLRLVALTEDPALRLITVAP